MYTCTMYIVHMYIYIGTRYIVHVYFIRFFLHALSHAPMPIRTRADHQIDRQTDRWAQAPMDLRYIRGDD